MTTLLDAGLISDTLESLPGWQGDSDRLWREVQLDDEQEAELRRQISVDAEAMGHAPSFEPGDAGTRIVLRTEEAGGVTELDVMMASHISDLVHRIAAEEPGVEARRTDETVAVFRAGQGGTGDDPAELTDNELPRDNTAMLES